MTYLYKTRVTDFYDSDTITVDLDLGFHAWLKKVKVCYYGIEAPEMNRVKRPDGLVYSVWLRRKILGKDIVMRNYKDGTGKYGRLSVELYRAKGNAVSIIQKLVTNGLAEPVSH